MIALGSLYEIYQHLGTRRTVFAALGFGIGEIVVRHRLRAGDATKVD